MKDSVFSFNFFNFLGNETWYNEKGGKQGNDFYPVQKRIVFSFRQEVRFPL